MKTRNFELPKSPWGRLIVALFLVGLSAAAHAALQPDSVPPDSTMTLSADAEGSVLRSLTIEGENRIQFDFERPELTVDLDPAQAPGLVWGNAKDVLDRTIPDRFGPLLALSVPGLSPYRPQPWRGGFRAGPVARFRPQTDGVASWQLSVVDARGEVVREFSGEKTPPETITWDGLDAQGAPAIPGLTYSYVFTAHDRAGNRKRFVGEGFEVPPFRLATAAGPVLIFSGDHVAAGNADRPGPLVRETASWLNRSFGPDAPVLVVATAVSVAQAEDLGAQLRDQLLGLIPGDPARIMLQVEVAPGVPQAGCLKVQGAPVAVDGV